MTHLQQKNVTSIQFQKGIVHLNHNPVGLFFFSRPQTHPETSEFWNFSLQNFGIRQNVLGSFRESLEIHRSQIIFGNSDTLQDKNLTPKLAQKKLAGIDMPLQIPNVFVFSYLPMYKRCIVSCMYYIIFFIINFITG